MRLVIVASIFLLVMAAANFYVYHRFIRKLSPALRRWTALIPALLMVGEVLFVLDAAMDLFHGSPWFYLVSAAFVGCTFVLFVVATVYDLVMTISRRVPWASPARRQLKIGFDVVAVAVAAAYVAVGLIQALSAPRLNDVAVHIKGFPFEHYTLVQLSDLHVGPLIRRADVTALVRRVNALHPDVVVITGDLVDRDVSKIADDLEPLRRLQAPAYFITGNHEYFHGPGRVVDFVRGLGITPLLNEWVRVGKGSRGFYLIGLNDLTGERAGVLQPDIDKAYRGTDPALPVVLLAHQPKTLARLGRHRCDLMISGHTHGGQIFPFGFLVMIDQPYLSGLHRDADGHQIFVSRGTGFWGPPLRVFAPAEITRIVLTPKSDGPREPASR